MTKKASKFSLTTNNWTIHYDGDHVIMNGISFIPESKKYEGIKSTDLYNIIFDTDKFSEMLHVLHNLDLIKLSSSIHGETYRRLRRESKK